MNASVQLLHGCIPAAVGLRTIIPDEHASVALLGSERSGTATVVGRSVLGSCLLLTAHYVAVGAESLVATLVDGTEYEARCLAIDFARGLAMLEIEEVPRDAVAVLPLRADDDPVRPGEEAFVLSRSEGESHACDGLVTAVGPFDAFWEYTLDEAVILSALYPGPGGGPIVDARGRMIGLAALSLAEVGRATLGIPATLCGELVAMRPVAAGGLATKPRAWLGLVCYPFAEHVVVASVMPGSPAETDGLLPGDVLVSIDGAAIADRSTLYRAIWAHAPGERIHLRVLREGGVQRLELTAGSAEVFFA